MADKFVTQLGAGLMDGSSIPNAWAVSQMVASWGGLGFTGVAGTTVYTVGPISSNFNCGFNSDGSIIRGDYPDNASVITVVGNFGMGSARPDIIFKREVLTECITFAKGGINIPLAAINCEVTLSEFNNCWQGVAGPGAVNLDVNYNVFNDGIVSDYGARYFAGATGFKHRFNTHNGFLPADALATGASTSNTYSGVQVDGSVNSNSEINNNIFGHMWADGIMIRDGASHVKVYCNEAAGTIKTPMSVENGFNIEVYNNTFVHDGFLTDPDPAMKLGNDFGVGLPSDNCTLKNNIFVRIQDPLPGINVALAGNTVGNNNTLDYNLYWNEGTDAQNVIRWTGDSVDSSFTLAAWIVVTGNKYEAHGQQKDPLFIDAANGNYNLQQSSPCVGVGTQWWGLDPRPESLSGEPLPDVKIDLGAYQSTWDANHPANL